MNREAFRSAESEFVRRHYEHTAQKDNHALAEGIEYSVSSTDLPPIYSLSITSLAGKVILSYFDKLRCRD